MNPCAKGTPGLTAATLGLSAALLGGCAASEPKALDIPYDAGQFEPARLEPEAPVLTEVRPLPLPGQLKPRPAKPAARKPDGAPDQTIASANAAARIEPSRDGYINAMQVFPWSEGALYRVYAAPENVTTIALQTGEALIDVSAGDTVRWVIGDTASGDGRGGKRVHVLVKPTGADLKTNLVILTDRRTYHLELLATRETYMASVAWTYPGDGLGLQRPPAAAAGAQFAGLAEPGIRPEALHFRYRIEGDTPAWRPLQAFDDGRKVYIEMPTGLAQGEAPPLFVAGPDGRPNLVNYRIRGSYYIVDRLFAAAELRLGEAPQRVVRIVRVDARSNRGDAS
jgi:P-type conjugative transfer protein TrbG